jgi:beta-glucanase (GH16 family)
VIILSSLRRRWVPAAALAVAVAGLAACQSADDNPQSQWASGGKSTASPGPAATTSPGSVRCPKPVAPAGWGALEVSEDFSGSRLDTTKWSVYDDPGGHVPRDPSRVTVAGGELRITGGVGANGKDVSGGVSSNVSILFGHADVCFRVDRGAGYSAIVLMWPQTENWPTDGEIDLAEVNRGARAYANSFVHNHAGNDRLGHKTVADFTQWHVVGMDWAPDHVTFYLDGSKQWTVGLDDRTAWLVPTTSAMHLTIQLDQGCDQFVECRNAASPAKVVMHTDWVRVYAYAGA